MTLRFYHFHSNSNLQTSNRKTKRPVVQTGWTRTRIEAVGSRLINKLIFKRNPRASGFSVQHVLVSKKNSRGNTRGSDSRRVHVQWRTQPPRTREGTSCVCSIGSIVRVVSFSFSLSHSHPAASRLFVLVVRPPFASPREAAAAAAAAVAPPLALTRPALLCV